MSKNTEKMPEWEKVLEEASNLQEILPEAVLVGGTASAIYAGHRVSRDADHILNDLEKRFDEVMKQLESVAGWKFARTKKPALILGSLNGIETGVRQLMREAPLETTTVLVKDRIITLPTKEEMLRIKGVLILRRNATRDYLDFAALADHLGIRSCQKALEKFDTLYPQESGESPLQQLCAQLANAMPFDLKETNLAQYKGLNEKWHHWETVASVLKDVSLTIFESVSENQNKRKDKKPRP